MIEWVGGQKLYYEHKLLLQLHQLVRSHHLFELVGGSPFGSADKTIKVGYLRTLSFGAQVILWLGP